MSEDKFEVWDRVTGRLMGEYDLREEAEAAIAGPYREDFIIIGPEDE